MTSREQAPLRVRFTFFLTPPQRRRSPSTQPKATIKKNPSNSSSFKKKKNPKKKNFIKRIMRRVSSRQRIRSFDDGFGRSCAVTEDEDFFFFDTVDDRKRKLHIIPPDDDENRLLALPDDLLLRTFGFCDREDLQQSLVLHSKVAKVLSSEEAMADIWKPIAIRMFPWMEHNTVALLSPHDVLTADPRPVPTHMDPTLFRRATGTPVSSNDDDTTLSMLDDHTVKFYGTTGLGDRSVRANIGFPKKECTVPTFLRRSKVQPFLMGITDDDRQRRIISTTTVYYEVTIGTNDDTNNDTTNDTPTSNDCVAVGLSLPHFRLFGRQPGWDHLSYGLHGDDGGLFHSGGQMIRKYCQAFQPGDTIGCGIHYETNSIFYTINGVYTGTAFTLKESEMQLTWYPTVGLDTNQPVHCNFGQTPFRYKEFWVDVV